MLSNPKSAGWQFFLEIDHAQDRLRLYARADHSDGGFAIIRPFEFKLCHREDRGEPIEPALDGIARDMTAMLQSLVDECWKNGIRPSGHDDFKRVNDAQGKHLADMRALVSKLSDTSLP